MRKSLGSRIERRWLAACAVLATAGLTAFAMARMDRARERDRAAVEAQAAALRGTDAVRALLSSLEAQVQNGAANPRLVAALDANVDRRTLLDLLLDEPWWEPFRRAVDGHGLVRAAAAPEISSGLPPGLELAGLVERARAANRPASVLHVAGADVYLVAAAPILLPGHALPPVLVAVKRAALAGVAERAGGAVAIADTQRILTSARASGVSAGGEDAAELRRMLGRPVGTAEVGAGGLALAAAPLAGDLRLLVRTGAGAGLGAPAGGPDWPVWATLAVGLLAAATTFVQLGRRAPAPPPARDGSGLFRPTTLTSVGRYTVVSKIGQGGMAEIYAAVSRGEVGFRRPVVLKRLRPELATDPSSVAQFCDEANLLAALHHPNIVGVQDFGRAGDELFLAEEYVLGRNLGRVVERSLSKAGRPPLPGVVAHVARELLEALDYAHNMQDEQGAPMGIVHRDISPENIMVSVRGEVKLLDFGVVKSATGRLAKTELGVIKGNVMFMSPEQARGLEVDGRADLYALALVIYFALTGRPLYKSQTTYGLLLKAGAGPDLAELAAANDLPEAYRPILARALAPRIEDRFQTAREMAAALDPLVRSGAGARVAGLAVTQLFKEEIDAEARRLANFEPTPQHDGTIVDRVQAS